MANKSFEYLPNLKHGLEVIGLETGYFSPTQPDLDKSIFDALEK